MLYADDLILGNLGLRDAGQVAISPLPLTPAASVTLTGPPEITALVSPEMLRLALLGKMVTAEDDVSLLPQDVTPAPASRRLVEAARRSLSNTVGYAWTSALLTVVATDPPASALVTMDTAVGWRGGHRTLAPGTLRQAEPPAGDIAVAGQPATGARPLATPAIEDLPGLRAQADQLTELLDLGFRHQEVLRKLGTSVTLGVLVTGPAGSGKSSMVQAVAGELSATVETVSGTEIATLTNNDAVGRLREAASRVAASGQAVLLVCDVEALAPRDAAGPREPAGPLATAFQKIIMDLVRAGGAVVCTTSRPAEVNPALRAPGALEYEIVVALPDAALRREQLAVLTRAMPLAGDVRLDEVAERTPGFVAADLAVLVREAGVRAALRQRSAPDPPIVIMEDFTGALEVVRPTSMATGWVELGAVSLDDVGDMAEVKEVLTESVIWPLSYPGTFARLGIAPPRGVLLYGPPGCGKTYLVRALAGDGRANLLSVKGAELLTKWVGESERAVRDLFTRARQAAPTLIFLDEVDALAPARGQSSDGGTTDRVVAALLTELDGVESLRDVVVVGATNRPDLIDPALLRPGRLERLVYVPPPNAAARAAILRASARRVPLAPDVDLDTLAERLAGFSAADCAALIRQAALAAMRESLEATLVTEDHVAAARRRVRPSLDEGQVAGLAAYAHQRGAGGG